MKLFKKKPNKSEKRFIAIAMMMSLFMGYLFATNNNRDEAVDWPYAAMPFAQEVSLSQARALLKEDPENRRAAVVGYTLVIEAVAGAGNDPDRLEAAYEDFVETKEREQEKAAQEPADPEEQKSEAEEDAKGTTTVDQPYEVTTNDIVLDVIKADFPSLMSGFVDHLVETSEFDIGYYTSDSATSAAEIVNILFMIILMSVVCFMVYSMVGKGNFGTSKSFTIIKPEDLTVGLDDVAGIGIAKGDVEEVIELLKSPDDDANLGARMPRGALFDGPPGTGKTLLAKAVAKEAGVTFISVDASSLSAVYVGLGAIKTRALFKQARKQAPCIVFIDEIDAAGKKRSGGGNPGSDEKENTLNALLTEMDGFDDRSGIFIIGATNRPEILDPALLRPGRIDRRITMTLPDIKGRQEILKVHCKDKPLSDDVDLDAISGSTYGLSGAQLANLVNEAALSARRQGRTEITQEDFSVGRDRALLPRSSSQISLIEEDRNLTAVHESGHALIAALCEHSDPIEKVTILPQGNALGFVMQAPDRDHIFHSRARLKDRIRVAVAGREAEKLVFGDDMVTTGAASDIQQATAVARAMVTTYGMSDAGFVAIDPRDPVLCESQGVMLGMVRDIISQEQAHVAKVLKEQRPLLDEITRVLEYRETISGKDVLEIVHGASMDDVA